VDDRGDFDRGQVHDRHAIGAGHFLVAHVEADVQDDAAVVARLLVPGDHDAGPDVGSGEVFEDLGHEALEEWAQVFVPEARCLPGGGRNASRLGLLDGNVEGGHGNAPFKRSKMGFDAAHAGLLFGHALDLGSSQQKHSLELFDRRVVVEHLTDLVQ
jgi:hypothetical protein